MNFELGIIPELSDVDKNEFRQLVRAFEAGLVRRLSHLQPLPLIFMVIIFALVTFATAEI